MNRLAQFSTPAQIAQFELYLSMLVEYNRRFNLTAIVERDAVIVKHFLDSLTLLDFLPKEPIKLIDIGSGAGFPGAPLKIVRPDIELTMLDGTMKKILFLRALIDALELKNARAVHGRAENLTKEFKGVFDVAVARAVADIGGLVKYAAPLLKKDGCFYALKGGDPLSELKNAEKIIRKMNCEVSAVHYLSLYEYRRSIIEVRLIK